MVGSFKKVKSQKSKISKTKTSKIKTSKNKNLKKQKPQKTKKTKKNIKGGGPFFSTLMTPNNNENSYDSSPYARRPDSNSYGSSTYGSSPYGRPYGKKNNILQSSPENNEVLKFLTLFNNSINCSEGSKVISDVLKAIYKKNNIKEFLNQGTTKKVFLVNSRPNEVFKIIIINNLDLLAKQIKEPMYMVTHKDICNIPYDINVYLNNRNFCTESSMIINNTDTLDNSSIITWYEERAKKTNISTFDDSDKKEAELFFNATMPLLKKDKFMDLGYKDIGLFTTEPKYRWIDLLPQEGQKHCFNKKNE